MSTAIPRRRALAALLATPLFASLSSLKLTGCSMPDLEVTLRRVIAWMQSGASVVQASYTVVNNTNSNITTTINISLTSRTGETLSSRMDSATFPPGAICYCLRYALPTSLVSVAPGALTLRIQIQDQVVTQPLTTFQNGSPGDCSSTC